MSDASTLPMAESRVLIAGFRRVKDPLNAGTFTVNNKGEAHCLLTSGASAETRVLQDAGGFGVGTKLRVFFMVDGGGAITITGAGKTIILSDAGDVVEFTVSTTAAGEATKVWRVTSDSREEAKTLDLPINAGLESGPWLADERTALTASSADPDCALIVGTHGSDNPLIRATNTLAAGVTEDFATITSFVVPDDYVAGGNLTITLAITQGAECDNPDLETNAFNRDDPDADIVASPTGDIDLSGGSGDFVIILTGTLVAPGDTIDVRFNFELTDTASSPIYDITRATLGYTGNAG